MRISDGSSDVCSSDLCLFNVLIDDMRLPQAIDAPRWSLSRDGQVLCEPGFPAEVVARLRDRGMPVTADSLHPCYFGSTEERRVGNGCVGPGRSRRSPVP